MILSICVGSLRIIYICVLVPDLVGASTSIDRDDLSNFEADGVHVPESCHLCKHDIEISLCQGTYMEKIASQ